MNALQYAARVCRRRVCGVWKDRATTMGQEEPALSQAWTEQEQRAVTTAYERNGVAVCPRDGTVLFTTPSESALGAAAVMLYCRTCNESVRSDTFAG